MEQRATEVVVIGGGIGGITAALALHRVGIEVRVLERAPELREVGAGLGLWMNALRVLDRLGVGERIRRLALPIRWLEGCSSSGRTLSRLDLQKVLDEPGAANFVVHRADLHAEIARELPASLLETGAECVGIEQTPTGVVARFRDRSPIRGAILIGADGFHSVVRRDLWGETPMRYSGQTCFRAISHLPPPDPDTMREVQGAGMRVGICPLDQGRVYWWAAVNAPLGESDPPEQRRERLLRLFAGWPHHLPELIENTPGEILRNDLVDRPPLAQWSRERVTLLGDAAHPMLPNLGQGACTAIEDALVLARSLATHGLTPEALRVYERERIGRTSSIVRKSWSFGIPARWSSRPAVALRERLVQWTPDAAVAAQIRQQVGYDAGSLPEGRSERVAGEDPPLPGVGA